MTRSLLARVGIPLTPCQDLKCICSELAAGAGAIMLTEEALGRPEVHLLEEALESQPAWSDCPVLILTRGGRDSEAAVKAMESMGNVILIERPVRVPTLVSAVRTALRSRLRQYQIRQHLEDRQKTEAQLRAEDRRKDEFLAMLAHELRNPLSAISNGVQLLRLVSLADQRHGATDLIEGHVIHLSRMIDDLLDVSRITRGKITLKRERIDMTGVFLSAAETVRPLIEGRGHEFILQLEKGPISAYADPTRLEQIFVNLLNNAAKYTDPGGTICFTSEMQDGRLVVAVKDNGIGMPKELLEDAFELFVQGDRGIARSEGGLGLGLTLVRSLVAMHGGTISAQSEGPGLGSEFIVALPLSRPGTMVPMPPVIAPEPPRSAPALRILVVDDNEDAADTLGELLRLYGHEVEVAHDGPAAVRCARKRKPDVVMLDIGLPGMDGYEVAATLRAEGFTETLLIAISGYAEGERSRESGLDHHLIKPVDFSHLKNIIAGFSAKLTKHPPEGSA